MPSFEYERAIFSEKMTLIAGVDEAGRGPWAGPVVAGAVIFPNLEISNSLASKLDDSKKLTALKRKQLFEELHESNALIGCGQASVEEIDTLNILQATFLAMKRAVNALSLPPHFALIDGNRTPKDFPCPVQTLVKGDSLSLSIAAASIIAKVTRDNLMEELAKKYPCYGWKTNSGYGTKAHQEGLKLYGITPHHRKSYAPIKKLL